MNTVPSTRASLGEAFRRGMLLRCPRCGEGKLFIGWFTMPERCPKCRLKYERDPGYFLGSTYINYGVTAVAVLFAYLILHSTGGLSNRQLAWPLSSFCVIFPLFFFRYARSLWLEIDCYFDPDSFKADKD
jgi:uncharacterized protein (DUF983 family)